MSSTALLLETPSIQKYIFASNKLKEIIGASHIIEHELFPLLEPEEYHGNIVYRGGGKAFYSFGNETNAREYLQQFTLQVLSHFPGLQINASISDYRPKPFGMSKKVLEKQLVRNRSLYPSQSLLPKEGIFIDCPQTNEYQEVDQPNVGWVSQVSKVKFDACTRAQAKMNAQSYLDGFVFTDETEKLGQQKDKGYIAVVHIDGNNIGQRFHRMQAKEEVQRFSDQLKKMGIEAMEDMIKELIQELRNPDFKSELNLDYEDAQPILPIRPILTGGDDITFVCEGRLGIYLAEKYIWKFENIANSTDFSDHSRITACAGVAIVKTKFPFSKAYDLAEALCKEAKEASRAKGDSWLSFYISPQGISGKLKELRKIAFESAHGSLTSNPYSLDDNHENALQKIKSIITHLHTDKWPINKIMELRDAVNQPKSRQQLFRMELSYRNHCLPDEPLWSDRKTRYWDAIQLLDFYPQSILKMKIPTYA